MPFRYKSPTSKELREEAQFLQLSIFMMQEIAQRYNTTLQTVCKLCVLYGDFQAYKTGAIPNTLFFCRIGCYGKYQLDSTVRNYTLFSRFFKVVKTKDAKPGELKGTSLTDAGKVFFKDIEKTYHLYKYDPEQWQNKRYNFHSREEVEKRRKLKPYYNLGEAEQMQIIRDYLGSPDAEKKQRKRELFFKYGLKTFDIPHEIAKFGALARPLKALM